MAGQNKSPAIAVEDHTSLTTRLLANNILIILILGVLLQREKEKRTVIKIISSVEIPLEA